jgi:hypothetical protein
MYEEINKKLNNKSEINQQNRLIINRCEQLLMLRKNKINLI